jgi:hypothetical protein
MPILLIVILVVAAAALAIWAWRNRGGGPGTGAPPPTDATGPPSAPTPAVGPDDDLATLVEDTGEGDVHQTGVADGPAEEGPVEEGPADDSPTRVEGPATSGQDPGTQRDEPLR